MISIVRQQVGTLLLLTSLLCLMTGCGGDQAAPAPSPTDSADEGEGGFGEAYTLAPVISPDAEEAMPHIDNDTLFVQIGYTGGCGEHVFSFRYRVERDTSRLWIHHESAGEQAEPECQLQLYEDLAFPVPERAQQAPVLVLLNPKGHPPVILKWGS